MAGKNEHRMLFDLRGGRRGKIVKVVYATLAVLMGLSLFLVVGGFNLSELFTDNGSSGDAAKSYEEQAERVEAKLVKNPEDPELLATLTRARVSAGNSLVSVEEGGARSITADAVQQYRQASDSWQKYLDATEEPSAGLAQLVSPMLAGLTEISTTSGEIESNIGAAAEAQQIVADQRPSLNSLSTLALYTYFTFDYAAAEQARQEAAKFATGKTEREALDKQMDEARKRAEKLQKQIKQFEAEQKAATGGSGGSSGSLEAPAGPLGSGFGE